MLSRRWGKKNCSSLKFEDTGNDNFQIEKKKGCSDMPLDFKIVQVLRHFLDLKENCHLLETMAVVTCKLVHAMPLYFSLLLCIQNLAGYFGIYEDKVPRWASFMYFSSVPRICLSRLFTEILSILLPHQRGLQFKSQTPVPVYCRTDRICGYSR